MSHGSSKRLVKPTKKAGTMLKSKVASSGPRKPKISARRPKEVAVGGGAKVTSSGLPKQETSAGQASEDTHTLEFWVAYQKLLGTDDTAGKNFAGPIRLPCIARVFQFAPMRRSATTFATSTSSKVSGGCCAFS